MVLQIAERPFIHKTANPEAFWLKDPIPVPHREEITREWRKLHNEKLNSSYP
jgi:hypothetical protein